MSLARRHYERVMAEKRAETVAEAAGERAPAAASAYELMRARLGNDLRRLREIQSVEKKIELKRELLPEYDDWVAGVLKADTAAEDDIVTHAMIWRIDIGDFAGALPIARHVLKHRLPLPERFDRTAPTLLAEEVTEGALKALGKNEPFDLAVLREVDALVAEEDIFDQVRAKLEKALGLAFAQTADSLGPDGPAGAQRAALTQARRHLGRAFDLDSKSGVKKRIEQIDSQLKKLGEEAA